MFAFNPSIPLCTHGFTDLAGTFKSGSHMICDVCESIPHRSVSIWSVTVGDCLRHTVEDRRDDEE